MPKQYVADVDEIRPQYVLDAPDANALFASEIVRSNGQSIASTIGQLENAAINNLNSEWGLALPSYSDQVLPFNITLAGANEYGAMTASKILGVEILNEGSAMSVDDAVAESQATFVARAIEPLQAVISPFHQVSPSFRNERPLTRGRGAAAFRRVAQKEGRRPRLTSFSPSLSAFPETASKCLHHEELPSMFLFIRQDGAFLLRAAGLELPRLTLLYPWRRLHKHY